MTQTTPAITVTVSGRPLVGKTHILGCIVRALDAAGIPIKRAPPHSHDHPESEDASRAHFAQNRIPVLVREALTGVAVPDWQGITPNCDEAPPERPAAEPAINNAPGMRKVRKDPGTAQCERRWNSVETLAQAIPNGEVDQSRNVDGLLMAVAEDIVETAALGGAIGAGVEFERLASIYDQMIRRLPLDFKTDPAFRAGQVSAMVEVLGALKDRAPSIAFKEQLGAHGNAEMLALLLDGERCAADLPKLLGKDTTQIDRMLEELQAAGVIVRQRSGRAVYVRLSMAARHELNLRDHK